MIRRKGNFKPKRQPITHTPTTTTQKEIKTPSPLTPENSQQSEELIIHSELPPSPKRAKIVVEEYQNSLPSCSSSVASSSTKSVRLKSGTMIEIPSHQKLVYSRRRKERAREVSIKLKNNTQLELRDWIYVKEFQGEQKPKFQLLREQHEKQQVEHNDNENKLEVAPTPKVEETNPLDGFTFKINDNGDLIFDQEVVTQPELDKSQFQRDFTSRFSELDSYKKALVKTKGVLGRPVINNRKWNETDCELFWRALSSVGQDFQLMETFFKANASSKTKNQLKSKFKREDRANPEAVSACLREALNSSLSMADFLK